MRLPGDRQTHPSDKIHVVRYIPGFEANPYALPDRSIWFGQQHRNGCMPCHTGHKIDGQSTPRRISTEQRVALFMLTPTLKSPGSIGSYDAGSSTLCESPRLHPVKEEKSHSRRLKGVVDRLPLAVQGVRSDATYVSKSEARHQEREDQCGSFHTHIIPRETNSRKKRTDVQGCIVPHRRKACSEN